MHLFIQGPDKNCCSTSQPDPNMESPSLIQGKRTIKFLCSFNPVPFQSKGWQLCPIFPNVCCYITLTNPPNSICAGPVDKNPITTIFWCSLGLNPGFRGYRERKAKHSKQPFISSYLQQLNSYYCVYLVNELLLYERKCFKKPFCFWRAMCKAGNILLWYSEKLILSTS